MEQERQTQHHVADPETLIGDVLDLRAYCLVVDHRSFTAAAKGMGETKGTISRRIARLEKALGATLLVRSPRSVETTDEGAAYRQHVGQVLELLGDANLAARRSHAVPAGHLRVTAPVDLTLAFLAQPIAHFAATYPDVHLEMVMTDRVLDFDKDNLDVALRATRRLPDSDLVAHKLFDTSLVFVASPAYLRAHRAPERLEDLAEHRVAFQGSTRARRKIEVSRPGARTPSVLEVRPALGSSDFAFVREMALAGGFLGIVPRLLVAEDVAAGRLVQLLAGYPVEGSSLYLLHRPARFLAPKVRVFVEHMQTDCLARRAAAQPSGRLART